MKKLIVVFISVVQTAMAQWSTDPNTNNPICTLSFRDKEMLQVSSDGSGGAWLVFSVNFPSTQARDIYMQKISNYGILGWSLDGLAICQANYDQVFPVISENNLGDISLMWRDARNGGEETFGQRIDVNGNVRWATDGISFCSGYAETNDMVADGTRGIIAVLVRNYNVTGNADIYASRIDTAGNSMWGSFCSVPICTATGDQFSPRLVSDGFGGAIIAWEDKRRGNWDIYVQRANSFGIPQWQINGLAVDTSSGDQQSPMIVSDGKGGAIITWSDAASQIKVQRVDSQGVARWTANGVVIGSGGEEKLISDGKGGAIIVWSIGLTDRNIYAQRVDSNGAIVWNSNSVALCEAPEIQKTPQIVSDGIGGAIVVWSDNRNGNQNPSDIYAQKINQDGIVQWTTNGVAISTDSAEQSYPVIVTDGQGGAIIAWTDRRNGNSGNGYYRDIYAQHVNPDGTLGDPTSVGTTDFKLHSFKLYQNYPNPFNPITQIRFSLAKPSFVSLQVYDLLGRVVGTLLNDRMQAGEHFVEWKSEGVPSAVYYYRVVANGFTDTKKMVLMK